MGWGWPWGEEWGWRGLELGLGHTERERHWVLVAMLKVFPCHVGSSTAVREFLVVVSGLCCPGDWKVGGAPEFEDECESHSVVSDSL